MNLHVSICVHNGETDALYIYIYIYRERERERERLLFVQIENDEYLSSQTYAHTS